MNNQNINCTYRKKCAVNNVSKSRYSEKKLNLLKQRLCGLLLLVVSIVVMSAVNEITAAFVIVPISLYIMFTKEQILTFAANAHTYKKSPVVHNIARQGIDDEHILIHNA